MATSLIGRLALRLIALGAIAIAMPQATASSQEPTVADNSSAEVTDYTQLVQSHFDFVLQKGRDEIGPEKTGLWLATIDARHGGLTASPMPQQKRWYRSITSPKGSNLYWDQPSVLAAYQLSRLTGENRYGAHADAYIREFLSRCTAKESGLFQWGNHIYFDVVTDKVCPFSGGYHECRPHTPAWETFWAIDSAATEQAIRAMGHCHVKDLSSGLFCRHANPNAKPGTFREGEVEKAKPFLEAGASLIDSLTWLAQKTSDKELARTAIRVARYSFARRDESTGLLRNQPVDRRWDYFASTTEVGLWAGSLLRASNRTGEPEFAEIADAAMRPWLRFGFDKTNKKYYGRLAVASGRPEPPEEPRGWKPPQYAEIFDIHERPTHNYPMPMAETCLSLYETTGDALYLEAVERWASQVESSLPANDGHGAYAEDYGRAIHFLNRAALALDNDGYKRIAQKVASEAITKLYIPESGAFRSHPGENRCDAIDGPGILMLALLYLQTNQEPNTAFSW